MYAAQKNKIKLVGTKLPYSNTQMEFLKKGFLFFLPFHLLQIENIENRGQNRDLSISVLKLSNYLLSNYE